MGFKPKSYIRHFFVLTGDMNKNNQIWNTYCLYMYKIYKFAAHLTQHNITCPFRVDIALGRTSRTIVLAHRTTVNFLPASVCVPARVLHEPVVVVCVLAGFRVVDGRCGGMQFAVANRLRNLGVA